MATIQTTAFLPEVGKCYEVHFGKVTLGSQTGYCSARIGIKGLSSAQWEDLDTGQPLDPRIGLYIVQAYKEIQWP